MIVDYAKKYAYVNSFFENPNEEPRGKPEVSSLGPVYNPAA
jgi:hypothetical protein